MSATPLPAPELGEPYLLTPGPLTTAYAVKQAMLKDWGSWDDDFRAMTLAVRSRLLALIGDGASDYDCVPIQGSGSYCVEAMLGSFVPRDGKVLVLSNGAYGLRAAQTLDYLGRSCHLLDKGDYLPPRGDEVAAILAADPTITHVLAIHCETSSGILNPVEEIAEAGGDIVRVSCPDEASTAAMKEICANAPVPIVADIHFHYKRGIEAAEMLKTFNCGIGLILVTAPDRAAVLSEILAAAGETPVRIGTVTDTPGIAYSGTLS